MIYLRCCFCDKVTGHIYSSIELKEPIKNYYDVRIDDYPRNTFNTVEYHIVNGLTYFPCEECYEKHMDVEARRKKLMSSQSKLINIVGTDFHFTFDDCKDCLFRYMDTDDNRIKCTLDSYEIDCHPTDKFPSDCPLPDVEND